MQFRLALLIVTLALAGCSRAQITEPTGRDSLAALLGADPGDRIGLVDGFALPVDIDNNGSLETVRLAWRSGGGSGTFDHLVIATADADGGTVYRYAAALGDRVRVRATQIVDATIVVDTLEVGPGDGYCCPGQKYRRSFALRDGALTETATLDQGRIGIDDLAGEWRLLEAARNVPVPEGVTVTLEFRGSRIGGSSGCNRYMGLVKQGQGPTDISLAGPLGGTRMACPGPADDIEFDYLGKLQQLTSYSWLAGNLVLSWGSGAAGGILIFAPAQR